MNDRKRLAAYLVLDLITTWVAWVLFNVVRFYAFRATIGFPDLKAFLTDTKSVVISLIIPWFWVFLHFMSGYYTQPRRKTNLGDLLHTMLGSLNGIIILFFAVVINDYPENPSLYYNILISYFLIQSVCNWLGRFMLTGPMVIGQAKGKNNVPVLVIGTGQAARQVMSQFNASRCNTPYRLEGFVRSGCESADQVPAALCLGEGEELADCIRQLGIEELFLALDHHQPAARLAVLNRL
jgi:FlaA1/EpsC-like NDP-sugar epimerase